MPAPSSNLLVCSTSQPWLPSPEVVWLLAGAIQSIIECRVAASSMGKHNWFSWAYLLLLQILMYLMLDSIMPAKKTWSASTEIRNRSSCLLNCDQKGIQWIWRTHKQAVVTWLTTREPEQPQNMNKKTVPEPAQKPHVPAIRRSLCSAVWVSRSKLTTTPHNFRFL